MSIPEGIRQGVPGAPTRPGSAVLRSLPRMWGGFALRARGVSGTLCQGIFRAPARGPFGTAQKGRKGRLGAAAPKNPFDVQQGACASYRRVDIVLPLRPLPGLRPYCVGIQAAPPPDTAPGAVGITGAPAPFLRSPPHPKGTSSALRASQRTMNGKRSREATILLS